MPHRSQFSDVEFALVKDYLVSEAGLVFDESRRAGLAAVLSDRVSSVGVADVAAYVGLLRTEAASDERQRLLDLVTVQETHFYRNPPQMEALRRHLLPELLRTSAGRDRPLTVWSAGCSTGEEPYTLAMMLLELSPMLGARSTARILGTDVSAEALRAAARATYTTRSLGAIPPTVASRWLEARPGSTYEVKDSVRRLVELRLHNLVTQNAPFGIGEVDLVVCRNVTIYFDRATTARLIESFHEVLAPGGYLVLGHSETLWQLTDSFALMQLGDAFVYRRAERPESPSPGSPGRPRHPGTGAPRSLGVPTRPAAQRDRPPGAPASAAPGKRSPLPSPRSSAPVETSVEELLAEAFSALAEGAYDRAAQAAAAATAVNSLLAPAYLVLGEAHGALGEDSKAVTALRKAVYLEPQHAHAHFLLAVSLARLGQRAPAAAAYRAAAKSLVSAAHQDLERFLGGRSGAELVGLCRLLAAEQEAAVEVAGAPAAPGALP